jgi:hypothetical protein
MEKPIKMDDLEVPISGNLQIGDWTMRNHWNMDILFYGILPAKYEGITI